MLTVFSPACFTWFPDVDFCQWVSQHGIWWCCLPVIHLCAPVHVLQPSCVLAEVVDQRHFFSYSLLWLSRCKFFCYRPKTHAYVDVCTSMTATERLSMAPDDVAFQQFTGCACLFCSMHRCESFGKQQTGNNCEHDFCVCEVIRNKSSLWLSAVDINNHMHSNVFSVWTGIGTQQKPAWCEWILTQQIALCFISWSTRTVRFCDLISSAKHLVLD